MSKLVKTKAKTRAKSHVLAGMGIGALAGVIAQGLSDDNSKDPKSYLLPIAIGAAIGGVIGGSIKTVSAENNEPENIEKQIAGKGVVFLHCADKSTITPTYEDYVRRKLEYSNGFQYDTVKKALEIAQKTKLVQEYFQLFVDKKNALFFIENDFTVGGKNADITHFLKDENYVEYKIEKNLKYINNHINLMGSKYFLTIEVNLFPNNIRAKIINNEVIKYSEREQIAKLLIIIGHELFIHERHLEIIKLWRNGKYQEAVNKTMEYARLDGDVDHQRYMRNRQNTQTKMNQYLRELKTLAKAGKVEISYSDIVKAITDHDNNYK